MPKKKTTTVPTAAPTTAAPAAPQEPQRRVLAHTRAGTVSAQLIVVDGKLYSQLHNHAQITDYALADLLVLRTVVDEQIRLQTELCTERVRLPTAGV